MAKLDTLFYFVAHELSSHVRILDRSGGEPLLYTRRLDLQDFFLAEPERESALLAFAQPEGPVLIQVGEEILYGLVQTSAQWIVAGPVLMVNGYKLRCSLSWDEMPSSFPLELQPCSLTHFAELMLLLHDCFNEDVLTLNDCLMDNSTLRESGEGRKAELQRQVHGKLEEQEKHNPYDHEQREMSCIENGDLQGLGGAVFRFLRHDLPRSGPQWPQSRHDRRRFCHPGRHPRRRAAGAGDEPGRCVHAEDRRDPQPL